MDGWISVLFPSSISSPAPFSWKKPPPPPVPRRPMSSRPAAFDTVVEAVFPRFRSCESGISSIESMSSSGTGLVDADLDFAGSAMPLPPVAGFVFCPAELFRRRDETGFVSCSGTRSANAAASVLAALPSAILARIFVLGSRLGTPRGAGPLLPGRLLAALALPDGGTDEVALALASASCSLAIPTALLKFDLRRRLSLKTCRAFWRRRLSHCFEKLAFR